MAGHPKSPHATCDFHDQALVSFPFGNELYSGWLLAHWIPQPPEMPLFIWLCKALTAVAPSPTAVWSPITLHFCNPVIKSLPCASWLPRYLPSTVSAERQLRMKTIYISCSRVPFGLLAGALWAFLDRVRHSQTLAISGHAEPLTNPTPGLMKK